MTWLSNPVPDVCTQLSHHCLPHNDAWSDAATNSMSAEITQTEFAKRARQRLLPQDSACIAQRTHQLSVLFDEFLSDRQQDQHELRHGAPLKTRFLCISTSRFGLERVVRECSTERRRGGVCESERGIRGSLAPIDFGFCKQCLACVFPALFAE